MFGLIVRLQYAKLVEVLKENFGRDESECSIWIMAEDGTGLRVKNDQTLQNIVYLVIIKEGNANIELVLCRRTLAELPSALPYIGQLDVG